MFELSTFYNEMDYYNEMERKIMPQSSPDTLPRREVEGEKKEEEECKV